MCHFQCCLALFSVSTYNSPYGLSHIRMDEKVKFYNLDAKLFYLKHQVYK